MPLCRGCSREVNMKTAIKLSLNERTADILSKIRDIEQKRTGQVHHMNHLANVAISTYYNNLILNNGDDNAKQHKEST